jgi:hypothetical protein
MKKFATLIFILLSIQIYGQIPSYVSSNGLIGWWPFNGNANDESGNGNDGTPSGTSLSTDRFGYSNSAYLFDGTSTYIRIANSLLASTASSFSFSYWVKPDTLLGDMVVISERYGMDCGYKYSSSLGQGNKGSFSMHITSPWTHNFVVATDTSMPGQWSHIVGTYDLNNTMMKIWVNGVLQDSSVSNIYFNGNNPTTIGALDGCGIPMEHYFDGVIDDIGFWNRAIDQQEITNLFNGSLPSTCSGATLPVGLSNGLVAWYPFCGNANDESGNGNNGNVNGAQLTTDRWGNSNSAYEFNGINTNIQTANSSSLSILGDFTLSAWKFEYPGSSNYNSIVAKRLGGDWSYNMSISKISGGSGQELNKIYSGRRNNNGAQSEYKFSNDSTMEGVWQHVLVTVTGDTINFFINGQNAGFTSLGNVFTIPMIDQTVGLTIGDCNCGLNEFMNGKLDDIGIWNRALSQQEITNLYNLGICYQTITVTDTLIINANLTGFNPIAYQNTIKVYPNPTNDQITIDCGANFGTMNGYSIRIDNLLSQTVYTTPISQQNFIVDLNTWTGNGIYLIYLINSQGTPIDVRKIVIQ